MSTTPAAPRKTRNEDARAARQEEILASARAVFARQGFRGTTIADIAEEAGVALGTIYLYFKSKDEVFAALSEEFNQIIMSALTNVPRADTLEQAVRLRINQVFEGCAENRDLVRLVVLNTDPDTAATRRMRADEQKRFTPLIQDIRAVIEAGAVRDADPEIMARLTVGAVSMSVYQAFVLDDGRRWEQFRDACCEMLVAYFTPPAA